MTVTNCGKKCENMDMFEQAEDSRSRGFLDPGENEPQKAECRVPPDVGPTNLPNTDGLLQQPSTVPSKRVIVIGAGASGIGAARTLIESGLQPIVLEARSRIGGRMHSTFLTQNLVNDDHKEDRKITVQLGANWIHGLDDSNPFYVVAKKLNLHLHMTSSDDEPGNDVILFDEGAGDITASNNGDSSAAFCRVTAQEYKEALDRYEWIRDNFERLTLPQKELHLKECLERVLTASEQFFGPCSECHRRCFNWFFDRVSIDLAAPLEYAATDSYLEVETDGFAGEALVSGGYFQVLDHLATEYPLDVRYEHVVSKITYVRKGEKKMLSSQENNEDNKDEATTNSTAATVESAAVEGRVFPAGALVNDGDISVSDTDSNSDEDDREEPQVVMIECTNGAVFEADACLVTLPIGVLQTSAVEFSPAIPKQISHLCSLVKAGLMNIVWLWYPYCFWPEDCNFLGVAHKDTALVEFGTFLAPPMFDQYGTKQAVLMCQVVGKFAEEVETMTEDAVAARATAVLRAMFGQEMVPDAIGCIHSAWKSDPFSRGSWTHIPYKDRGALSASSGSGATDSVACDSCSNYSMDVRGEDSTVDCNDHRCDSSSDNSDSESNSDTDDSSSSDDDDGENGAHGGGTPGRKAGGRHSRKMVRFSFELQQQQQQQLLGEQDHLLDCCDEGVLSTSFGACCDLSDVANDETIRTLLMPPPLPVKEDSHSAPLTITHTIDDVVYYSGEASNTEHRGTAHSAYMCGIEEAQKMVFYLSLVTR